MNITTVEEAKKEIKNGFERRILELRGDKEEVIRCSLMCLSYRGS